MEGLGKTINNVLGEYCGGVAGVGSGFSRLHVLKGKTSEQH